MTSVISEKETTIMFAIKKRPRFFGNVLFKYFAENANFLVLMQHKLTSEKMTENVLSSLIGSVLQ